MEVLKELPGERRRTVDDTTRTRVVSPNRMMDLV